LRTVKTFFASIASYLTSPAFIAKVVGTVIVIALAVVLYRVALPPGSSRRTSSSA
jgi:uncharacterized membrane protein